MSQWDMVMVVAVVMEGEAFEWLANLYSDHAAELGDMGLFLSTLQKRFEANTRAQQAEGDLLKVKQRGRPISKYIKEFRWLIGKVRGWPERLVVYHLKAGLDWTLWQACICQRLAPRLVTWFQAVMELDVEFWDE